VTYIYGKLFTGTSRADKKRALVACGHDVVVLLQLATEEPSEVEARRFLLRAR
jgi:hypothetical protein